MQSFDGLSFTFPKIHIYNFLLLSIHFVFYIILYLYSLSKRHNSLITVKRPLIANFNRARKQKNINQYKIFPLIKEWDFFT